MARIFSTSSSTASRASSTAGCALFQCTCANFKRDQTLMIPHLQETVVEGVAKSEKITIEHVAVNPGLDDARFTNK